MEPKLGHILRIALPIVVSNASHTAMLFVDRLFLARVGKHELAASMSGGLFSMVVLSFFLGLIGYVSALVAQYYGAGRRADCTRATTQAIVLAIASYPIVLCFIPFIGYGFAGAGQDPALVAPATAYAKILMAGSIFLILRTAFASFFVGIGKTRIVMFANLLGTLVNIPLNYILIFGKFGLPEMGIRGAAIGTIGGEIIVFSLLCAVYLRDTARAPYRVRKPFRFVPDIMKRIFRFGTPAGMEPFLSFFAFNVFLQTLHSYGPDVAGAATIAFSYDAIAFLPMLGLGVATSTVVGQNIGAGDYDGAGISMKLTMRIGLCYAFVMVALFLCFAEPFVLIFSSGLPDAGDNVSARAVDMLRMVTLYTFAMSCKFVLSGALRAAGDTAWLMWTSVGINWIWAIIVVVLVRVLHVHPYVAWITLALMSNVHALIAFYRYRTGVYGKISK